MLEFDGSREYGYDISGRISMIGDTEYKYDAAGRIIAEYSMEVFFAKK